MEVSTPGSGGEGIDDERVQRSEPAEAGIAE